MSTRATYLVFIAIIALLLIGGVGYINSTKPSSIHGTETQLSKTHAYLLTVKNRKIVNAPSTLTAKQGDTVSITILADESDELHVHGYDKHIEFTKDTPATLTFIADKSGRFPFEMEGSKTDLGEIDVLP